MHYSTTEIQILRGNLHVQSRYNLCIEYITLLNSDLLPNVIVLTALNLKENNNTFRMYYIDKRTLRLLKPFAKHAVTGTFIFSAILIKNLCKFNVSFSISFDFFSYQIILQLNYADLFRRIVKFIYNHFNAMKLSIFFFKCKITSVMIKSDSLLKKIESHIAFYDKNWISQ